MWLDAFALVVLGLFAGVGVARGGLATGLSLFSLFAAYGAAIVLGGSLGPRVADRTGMPEFGGVAIVGTCAFFLTFIVVGIIGSILRRREARRRRGQPRSARDRFLGATFGVVRGALVVLLLCYLAIWLDVLRQTGTAEILPGVGDSAAAAVTESVVEAGLGVAMADQGAAGRLVARMAARPGATLVEIQDLVEDPRFQTLRDDRSFWTYVEHGAVDSALNRPSFLAISGDPSFRGRLAELGFVSEEAAGDRRVFLAQVADVMREVGPRVRSVRNDPQMQELMEDPEVAEMVRSGNTIGLMTHPGFRQLVARATASGDGGS
jgi:uncharacterized membrane protein required for colicin V production